MIIIDGSHGEGGGQIVRTAIAFSIVTQMPVTVNNIRAGRRVPGLKNQHLHAILALGNYANVEHAYLGSTSITCHPTSLVTDETIVVDVKTAGSITLVLQTMLLPILFSNLSSVQLLIKGGTDVQWSPSIDYFKYILLPAISPICDCSIQILRRGYSAKGGGEVLLDITPLGEFDMYKSYGHPMNLSSTTNADVDLIDIYVSGSNNIQRNETLEKVANITQQLLKESTFCTQSTVINQVVSYTDSTSNGSSILLKAHKGSHAKLAGSYLMEKKREPLEIAAKLAIDNLRKEIESDAFVDEYLSDQLLPFLALTGGSLRVREISDHFKSNCYVLQAFLPSLKIDIQDNVVHITHSPPLNPFH
ncbi:RNA 3'-terminal phosphate cyclase domain-containing protein [Globomyces pollinis-pini]|nr:RNA 3'-terminal phosphate cyclase domain-containing protein [Globomyces pollinis-pini]